MIHLTFDYKSDKDCTTPGQYLKYHRTFQGLTTRELAEKVGTTYSGWERESRIPRRKEHEKILAAMKKLKVDIGTYLCQ